MLKLKIEHGNRVVASCSMQWQTRIDSLLTKYFVWFSKKKKKNILKKLLFSIFEGFVCLIYVYLFRRRDLCVLSCISVHTKFKKKYSMINDACYSFCFCASFYRCNACVVCDLIAVANAIGPRQRSRSTRIETISAIFHQPI